VSCRKASHKIMSQSCKERDLREGSTDTPLRQRRYNTVILKMPEIVEPQTL
jgi:hypothetical protein